MSDKIHINLQNPGASQHNAKIKPGGKPVPKTGIRLPTVQNLKSVGKWIGVGTLNNTGRAWGVSDLLREDASLTDRIRGGVGIVNPKLGAALAIGEHSANAYVKSTGENSNNFVSGRGSGSAALSGVKQRQSDQEAIASTIPQELKQTPAGPTPDELYSTAIQRTVTDHADRTMGDIVETARSGGSGGGETRTNGNGVVQRGLTLGGINSLYSSLSKNDKMVAGELGSANQFFSEALPTTEGGEEQASKPFYNENIRNDSSAVLTGVLNGADTEGLPTLSTPSGPSYGGSKLGTETNYFNQTDSTPETTSNPSDPQDGASEKPDVADNVRTVRMARKGVNGTVFGGEEPDDSSLVSPMYRDKDRNAARAAFLNPNNKGYAAIRARDRAVGAFDQNGTGVMNVDGKLHQFKDGMSRDARFALSGGGINSKEKAQSFLNQYVKGFGEAPETTEVQTQTAPVTPNPEQPASEQTDTTLAPTAPAVGTPGKPQTVPLNQIPSASASQAEWDKYYKQLQGGELTGPNPYAK